VDGSPKLPIGVPNPIPYCPIWGHDALRSMEKEKFINVRLFKYVESGKKALNKMQLMR